MKEFLNEMAVLLQGILVLLVEICCVLSLRAIAKNWRNFMIMKNDRYLAELLGFGELACSWDIFESGNGPFMLTWRP